MNGKKLMTYSLLSHIRDSSNEDYSSLVGLFFPVVKKAIVEYANEKSQSTVLGENIAEIREKIIEYFGIDIPISVLDFILSQISKEINDEKVFVYNKDKSFIINAFHFDDLDKIINEEKSNIEVLKSDYKRYCVLKGIDYNEFELFKMIDSLGENALNDDISGISDNPELVNYLNDKLKDDEVFEIISDIYLGSLIANYLEYKIDNSVSDTELLIDTNFYISLIDLNTSEAYITCNQLFELCNKLGFRFSILFSTVDQIKYLLSRRIQDFANKEIGLVKEADIFGACIRRELNKTDLERIKDKVDSSLKRFGIEVIHKVQIRDLVDKASKSKKYKELLEIRDQHHKSALNDALAYHYVMGRRGDVITEFSDVQCWFLNNSYSSDYHALKGYKIHERYKISANELLSLLWLANPSQKNVNNKTLAYSGISTFIAKYRNSKLPSTGAIKDILKRAKKASEDGEITDKEIYNLSIRMSESQLSTEEVEDLSESSDEIFIKKLKSYTDESDEYLEKLNRQFSENKKLRESNEKVVAELKKTNYILERDKYIDKKISALEVSLRSFAWRYSFFVIVIVGLWFVNEIYATLVPISVATLFGIVLFVVPLFFNFVNHTSLYKSLRFTISKSFRKSFLIKKREDFIKEYQQKNPLDI